MPFGVTQAKANPAGVVKSTHRKAGVVQSLASYKGAKLVDPHKKPEAKKPVASSNMSNTFEKLAMN